MDRNRVKQTELRLAWETATEHIDAEHQGIDHAALNWPGVLLYHASDMQLVLGNFAELADAVQRYLGITVNHNNLKEDNK